MIWRRKKEVSNDDRSIPLQVCQGGCGYSSHASRRYKTKSGLLGRAIVTAEFTFESVYCPLCGSQLASQCIQCRAPVLSAAHTHCHGCGVLYPWAYATARGRARAVGRNWKRVATPIWNDGDRTLWMITGDITALSVEALVSDDDNSGHMRTGAAVAIKAACGEDVEFESIEQGPHLPGTAWDTDAGRLSVKRIIHVAAVDVTGKSTIALIRTAAESALRFAEEHRLGSVALPIMGAGTAGLDFNDCVDIIARAGYAHLSESCLSVLHDVVLVSFKPDLFEQSCERAKRATSGGT
jgi:O-acetyl-ADP-ribose deacetylase (regulator of RNase III)/predicted RNA-binding Zn-ribbon protein involved in translation (DUF1610 family)